MVRIMADPPRDADAPADQPIQRTYSGRQLRTRLKLGDSTISALLRSGELRGWKLGKYWRVPEWSVREFEERKMQELADARDE